MRHRNVLGPRLGHIGIARACLPAAVGDRPVSKAIIDTHAGMTGTARAMSNLLAPALPAFCGVLDLKVRHDLARRVDDDHLVMIVCPVEARVVSDLAPWLHFCDPVMLRVS